LASGHPIFLHADTPDPTTLIYPLNQPRNCVTIVVVVDPVKVNNSIPQI